MAVRGNMIARGHIAYPDINCAGQFAWAGHLVVVFRASVKGIEDMNHGVVKLKTVFIAIYIVRLP